MAVICKKCGGQHPMWDCKAAAAQIAAYRNSDAPKVRRDYANRLPAQTRKSTAARKEVHPGSSASVSGSAQLASVPGAAAGTQARPVDKKQRPKPAAKAGAGSRPRSAPAAKSKSSKLSATDPPRSGSAVRKGAEATTAKVGNVGASAGRSHSRLSRVPTESPASVPAEPHRGRGRPKTIVDMRAYKAQKERERRARLKQKKSK